MRKDDSVSRNPTMEILARKPIYRLSSGLSQQNYFFIVFIFKLQCLCFSLRFNSFTGSVWYSLPFWLSWLVSVALNYLLLFWVFAISPVCYEVICPLCIQDPVCASVMGSCPSCVSLFACEFHRFFLFFLINLVIGFSGNLFKYFLLEHVLVSTSVQFHAD